MKKLLITSFIILIFTGGTLVYSGLERENSLMFGGGLASLTTGMAILGSLPDVFWGLLIVLSGLILLGARLLEVGWPAVCQSLSAAFQLWWTNLGCQIQPAFCDYERMETYSYGF